MARFPHLPLFTDAYMADTLHLTHEEHGLYLMLLMTIWRSPDCKIPNDLEWVKRRLRATDQQMENLVKNLLDEFFTTTGNHITQKRLKEEYEYVRKNRKRIAFPLSHGGKRKNRYANAMHLYLHLYL